jgi:hypothetical protein
MSASRRRLRYLFLAIGTIGVGLMVHVGGSFLPAVFRDAAGDALWAMMIVWWTGVAASRLRDGAVGSPVTGKALVVGCPVRRSMREEES